MRVVLQLLVRPNVFPWKQKEHSQKPFNFESKLPPTWTHFDYTSYFIGDSCIIAILHEQVCLNTIWALQWCLQSVLITLLSCSNDVQAHPLMTYCIIITVLDSMLSLQKNTPALTHNYHMVLPKTTKQRSYRLPLETSTTFLRCPHEKNDFQY